ncbi:altronate dehydratase [Methylobacterium mesophilicum SR1.6/6]|uniref:Altronate dehydratase n=1 Tax=Methylobacterium mesophilicum SR1.6/6 TaxID=908290 RepID=A0A6B9FCK8_9HYPH|nr:UxaA family hydrolase [Methylobacterium mesophilicum]QGY00857.1 altronate dehydratase [Methylobacterium mesophilicum SR1.6/6]
MQTIGDPVLRVGRHDNVVLARVALSAGASASSEGLTITGDIPVGHKIVARSIQAGEPVVKGEAVIGLASRDMLPGEHLAAADLYLPEPAALSATTPIRQGTPSISDEADRPTFQGFVRPNGDVATRNYVGLFVVGNCGATVARKSADYFDELLLAPYPNVDGVVPFVHEIGCGMEMTGEPMDLLRRTISGFIRNPNIAAAVIVALGCERNNLGAFLEQERLAVGDKLRTVTIQEVGGITNAVEAAKRYVREMLPTANAARRETVSVAHLRLGLQSGGTDAFSGFSADPALGHAVDLLVRHGGTAVLSGTPEVACLAGEFRLRAATPQVADAFDERVEWWRQYGAGKDILANGRVGRASEAAGVSNLLEKVRGTVKKAGTAPIAAVYRYAERVGANGLVFMDTPTYEPVSVTGQIAGGATLIAFTTGLGSSFGSLPAPTVKLAATSALFARMEDDMDVDCGPVLDGKQSVEVMGRAIFEQLLRHASGEATKSEEAGMGENEFVPWPIGVLA